MDGSEQREGSDAGFQGNTAHLQRIRDISLLESTRALSGIRSGVIVNTAAMHHVDNCEKEPLRAYEVNALGPRNLAIVARKLDAKLVHVSTDYVFDGAKAPTVRGRAPRRAT
jgi:dTDP-4-dehydrorhamnose reductase